jgi:predicted ATP-grasp superfamily ATP-dependent carboligase
VLLLDAHLRHALAIVRSLGRSGVPVVMASPRRRFPAKYSRFGENSVLLDESGAGSSVGRLLEVIETHRIDVVIPAALTGNELLCRHRAELEPHVIGPFNELETFQLLANKANTISLADRLGVARPGTRSVASPADGEAAAEELGFPLVFKSPLDQGTVRFPSSLPELQALISGFARENPDLVAMGVQPLVQEHVAGTGHGFFGLAEHGQLRAYFMHERIHEVPPSGGPSAMAKSYRDPELKELGERFFTATSWHGVAMVEFKRRADGKYFLIEVNPKFWGSLDLSIYAGVDFPALTYRLLTGSPLSHEAGAYRNDAIFRWLTMDLAYSIAVKQMRGYFRSFRDPRIADDFDRQDPLPTAALFASGLALGRAAMAV